MQAGIVTSYLLGEDWGGFIEYREGEAEFRCHFSKSTSANDQSRCQRNHLEPTPPLSEADTRVWRARYSVAW